MVLIIDGHNLIPHLPGVSLADPDDELALVRMLQDYCRLRRKQAIVYFDRAPAGQPRTQVYGQVQAHFVPSSTTADAAIMAHLGKLGKRAKNMTVVSSDRQVQAAARAAHARVVSSEEFAAEWAQLEVEEPALDPRNRLLSEEEVDAWEQFFKRGHPPSGGKA